MARRSNLDIVFVGDASLILSVGDIAAQ